MNTSEQTQQAARLLAASRRTLVVTGAGVSRASGLPTYRGVGGLYNDPEAELPPEVVLSRDYLAVHPETVLQTLQETLVRARDARPCAAHKAIADMQAMTHVTVLTQNVDGFHRDAGSGDVIEIHGSARRHRCLKECGFVIETDAPPERCPDCGAMIRPDVVLFNEDLPEAAVDRLLQTLAPRQIELVIVVGTTCMFPYVCDAIRDPRCIKVFIDPEPSDNVKALAGPYDLIITEEAETALPRIVNLAWELLSSDRS